MAKIFISSTEDLRDYQKEAVSVLHNLGHEVLLRDLDATYLAEHSFAAIDSSDIFVSIIARRYGDFPDKTHKDNPYRQSLIELEFRYAREHKKYTLVFIIRDDVPWPAKFRESDEHADRLEKFRKSLSETVGVRFFSSPETLVKMLVSAVSQWENDRANPPSAILPFGVDPFELAWRLIVDSKAEPALLRHMDPNALKEAVEKWAQESGRGTTIDQSQWYEAAHKELQAKQTNLSPNALWLAWMRTTRTHLLPLEIPNREIGRKMKTQLKKISKKGKKK